MAKICIDKDSRRIKSGKLLCLYLGLGYVTIIALQLGPVTLAADIISSGSDNNGLTLKTNQVLKGVEHFHDEDGHIGPTQLNIHRTSAKNSITNGSNVRITRATNSNVKNDGVENDETGSTTSTACLTNSAETSCCLQYTWPGNERTQNAPPEDPTSNITRTCAQIKEDDPNAACFDPIVYAYSNYSTRPDPQLVRQHCINNAEACFCAARTCIKYTLYRNDELQTRINETHFCGTVTETRTDNILTSGCYKEQRGGRIFEVCVCQGDYCNSAPELAKMSVIVIAIFSLISYFLFN